MTNTNEMELRSYKVSESDTGFALKIECFDNPIQIERPVVNITKRANEHTMATITGFINQNTYENFALRMTSEMDIKITYRIEREDIFLFQGVIQQLEVDTQGLGANIVYKLTIEASSYTSLMDIEKKNRSFQNAGMLYDEMLKQVTAGYNHADVLNYAAAGQVLGSFTMQYKETDWEYLKRMGSRFYVPLIADHKSGGPRFSVGVGQSSAAVMFDDYEYKVVKAAEDYRVSVQNYNAAMNEIDFIYYDIKTIGPDMESLQVGDAVWFQEKLFYIIAAEAQVKDYVLSHTYRLGLKNGFFCPSVFNEAIGGLSLQGTVIKVSRNMLKVHLDIDASQAEGDAHWFQYSTFYSTWYCMPEIGDCVNVHFPSVEESAGIVLNSVRRQPTSSSQSSNQQSASTNQMQLASQTGQGNAGENVQIAANEVAATKSNASASGSNQSSATLNSGDKQNFDLEALAGDDKVKMIATESGKMLILDDRSGSVSIVCDNGTYVKLSSGGGISIITDQAITLSGNNICLNAKKKVSVKADEQLLLECGSSNVELTPAQVLINGNDILLNS